LLGRSVRAASDYISFSAIFRQELHAAVEFSFSSEPQTYGTMLAGAGPGFAERVKSFGGSLPFAAGFSDVVDRFGAQVATDAYLFKVDWRGEAAERLSMYFRFLRGVPQRDLERGFERARPLCWHGPAPHSIGEAIGAGSPVIVGLRVDKEGAFQTSVYFNYVEAGYGRFTHRVLEPLVRVLQWAADMAKTIGDDVTPLLPHSAHAAIGFDSASATTPVTLKIAAADVSWVQAATTLSKKGVPESRLLELAAVGRQFRQARLNYAAMKFGPSGFLGWKLYWAMLWGRPSSGSITRMMLS
jgi:hypothetical protein